MTLREGLLAHTLQCARDREVERAAYIKRVRLTLRELATEGLDLEPFPGGTVLDQLRHEMLDLRADFGDPLAAERRTRRNKKIAVTVRRAVYRRDNHTCQECGWRSPRPVGDRITASSQGLWLTIDHVIPLAEGGPNHISNLRTLCSRCNPAKGHALPDAVPGVAA